MKMLLTQKASSTRAGDAGSENAEQKQEEASAVAMPQQPTPVHRPQTQALQVSVSCNTHEHSEVLQAWLSAAEAIGAGSDCAAAPHCLQEAKAESSPAASGLQSTLLQQTSGWESEKHAALERFFNRQQPAATAGPGGASRGVQGRPAGKPPTAVFGAFYDIIKNPPKAGGSGIAVREPENGPLRHATRTSRYNPYARPQARTSAGHMNR
jgi:hypothetical protein